MKEQFEKYIEELKLENADSVRIKEYILRIKTKLDEFISNCDGELTKEECLEQFIEEYYNNLIYDKNELLGRIFPFLLQYISYKEILNIYKSNKSKFKKVLDEAKKREKMSKGDRITISLDGEEQIIKSLMAIIRENPDYKEKEILSRIQIWKSNISGKLKDSLIKSIRSNIAFLEEFGILDTYINEANDNFEKLDLDELKVVKRNPIADEYGDGKGNRIVYNEEKKCYIKYDDNGNIIRDGEDLTKYDEDPGVIDMFDEEYLKRLSPEDLLMLDMFWRGKFLQERMEITKAMSTIRDLDLWNTIINGEAEEITKIDDSIILETLKTYYGQKYEYDNPENEQEKKSKKGFFKRKFDKSEEQQTKNIIDSRELEILTNTLRDLVSEECIIISKLKAKDFSIRGWGTLDNDMTDASSEETIFVIDNANFRGPVILSVPTEELKRFFGDENIKFPVYKGIGKIDFITSSIMEKLYLPASNYFKRKTMEKYKKNPNSKTLALLTGKKIKEPANAHNNEIR